MPPRPRSDRYQPLPSDVQDIAPSNDADMSRYGQRLESEGTRRSLQERQYVIPLICKLPEAMGLILRVTVTSLSMIALAGMIGTGLFLSSGKAVAQAGPLGCVLGFIIVSF